MTVMSCSARAKSEPARASEETFLTNPLRTIQFQEFQ